MKLKKQSLKQFQLLFILFAVSDCQHYNSLVSRMVLWIPLFLQLPKTISYYIFIWFGRILLIQNFFFISGCIILKNASVWVVTRISKLIASLGGCPKIKAPSQSTSCFFYDNGTAPTYFSSSPPEFSTKKLFKIV